MYDNLKTIEEFVDFENDMKDELSWFGEIEKLLVPKPSYLF